MWSVFQDWFMDYSKMQHHHVSSEMGQDNFKQTTCQCVSALRASFLRWQCKKTDKQVSTFFVQGTASKDSALLTLLGYVVPDLKYLTIMIYHDDSSLPHYLMYPFSCAKQMTKSRCSLSGLTLKALVTSDSGPATPCPRPCPEICTSQPHVTPWQDVAACAGMGI